MEVFQADIFINNPIIREKKIKIKQIFFKEFMISILFEYKGIIINNIVGIIKEIAININEYLINPYNIFEKK